MLLHTAYAATNIVNMSWMLSNAMQSDQICELEASTVRADYLFLSFFLLPLIHCRQAGRAAAATGQQALLLLGSVCVTLMTHTLSDDY